MTTLRERAQTTAAFTGQRVGALQARYLADDPTAVAALAQLRRAVGTELGSDFAMMNIAFAAGEPKKPENRLDLLGGAVPTSDAPEAEENAFFAAITLFAMHQQSHRDASMHRSGYGFGRSMRLLYRRHERPSTRDRFTALGTAETWAETLHHARSLIQQLRQESIPLDYAQFAQDLFDLQTGQAARVRLAWGRDFYRVRDEDDDTETTEA